MSWMVSGQGKAGALAAKLAKDFAKLNLAEPEQTIKNSVAGIVAAALAAFPPEFPVEIAASGSQCDPKYNNPTAEKINSVNFKITPIFSWVE